MNNKNILLKGTSNQHTLYGKATIKGNNTDFPELIVEQASVLKHEQPDGSFGEHKALAVEAGDWRMGKQIEYNPFNGTVSQVWD